MVKIKNLDPTWITVGINSNMAKWAESFAQEIVPKYKTDKNGLTTTQLRRFFGQMKKIQISGIDKEKEALYMLKPELAYAVSRAKGGKMKNFQEQLNKGLDLILTEVDKGEIKEGEEDKRKIYFDRLMKIMEAIVAYHKVYEPK